MPEAGGEGWPASLGPRERLASVSIHALIALASVHQPEADVRPSLELARRWEPRNFSGGFLV